MPSMRAGRHDILRTECLASETCVDTCPRSVTLERQTRERHRLCTTLLHENQGWSLVGGRGGHVSRQFDLSRPTFSNDRLKLKESAKWMRRLGGIQEE